MAEQDRGVNTVLNLLHNYVAMAWAAVSVVAYAIAVLCVAPFNNRFARYIAHIWCFHLMAICGIRIKTVGMEKLRGMERCVFIANHQSYFDIPVLYTGLKHPLSFIAKKELFIIPFFGWGMAAVGHIWIDRDNARAARKSITRAISRLKRKGVSLVLFPEGTRSVSGEIGEFKRGSFTLAFEAGVPVVPVSICGTRDLLPKKSGRFRPGTATIVIGDPLSPEDLVGLDKTKLSEIMKERIVAGSTLHSLSDRL